MRPTGRRGLVSTVVMVGLSMAVLCSCDPSPPGAAPTTSSTAAVPRATSGRVATPSSLVDTFVGTGVGGSSVGSIDTFPGADMPFGMLQWSPDTFPDRTSGGGYAFKDSAITGFSLTHMSGPGCPVYGDIPILPTVGPVGSNPAATTAAFSHASEVASPGNYAVTVGRPAVRVELAVTTRAGLGRLRFPGTAPANVLFKVADSAAGSARSAVTVVGANEVDGSVVSGNFCGTSADYHLYFAARFQRDFRAFGTWHAKTVTPRSRRSTKAGTGAYVTFPASTRDVEVQVGVSFVSVADARLNIGAEHPGWDIDALRQRDTATWNELLGRVQVTGGTAPDERTFYSELYHSMLHPNVFDDANGDYIGFDDKVHVADGYTQYANFSLWDVYRSEVQLLALVVPQRTSDMVRSLLADAAQGGGLPKLPAANFESAQLNGDSADAFIASAYAFGARDFDTAGALAAMVKGATDPEVENGGHLERQDLAQYLAKGYVRADTLDLTSLTYTVGASETLEYAIDDSAIAQLALALGDTAVARTFSTRAQSWQNLVNPATDFLGGRRADGTFPPGPAFQRSSLPGIGQVGFEEGNAIQYTWSVPQNLRGLFDALGGNAAVVAKLNRFFTHLNAGRKQPYDWAGDEPSLGIPWEYDYAGAPFRTQDVVRRIATTLYGPTPDGEPGNDDLGAMSSWYVWAAMGLYPETPGRGELVLASPLFPHITLTLGDGHAIVIDAPGASPATPYVQGLEVAGLTSTDAACGSVPSALAAGPAPYTCPWLPATVSETGARLDVALGEAPDRSWGSASTEAPPSFPALPTS
ncbi:MAG TPA: GH92 family glycosyl hydrolase [Acidimicrobiales bacterium]|nr:GH92 family glycosyl hydrolase [Acidimicrobiales bacterium]